MRLVKSRNACLLSPANLVSSVLSVYNILKRKRAFSCFAVFAKDQIHLPCCIASIQERRARSLTLVQRKPTLTWIVT